MRTLSVRLPERLDHDLEQEARDEGTTRSDLAREAISEFLERRERERFLATLRDEARMLRGDPATRRVRRDFAGAEAEALEVAEGSGSEHDADERWWD